jgi:hypothetical protein
MPLPTGHPLLTNPPGALSGMNWLQLMQLILKLLEALAK